MATTKPDPGAPPYEPHAQPPDPFAQPGASITDKKTTKAGKDKAKKDKRAKDLQAHGLSAADAKTQADAEAAAGLDLGSFPDVEKVLGRPVNEADYVPLMNAWNSQQAFNPNQQVHDPKKIGLKLSQALKAGDTSAQFAIQHSGQTQTEYTLQLGANYGNRKVTIPVATADLLQKTYGIESQYMPTIAGMAETIGLGSNGVALLTAAMAANRGLQQEGIDANRMKALGNDIITNGQTSDAPDRTLRMASVSDTAYALKAMLDLYHDPTMALIATQDPNLAAKMIAPDAATSLTSEDRSKLQGILGRAKWGADTMAALGFSYDPVKIGFIEKLAGGSAGGSGGSGNQVNLPDPASVRQSLDTLFRSWFQRPPTGEELAHFAEQVNAGMTAVQMKGATPTASGGVTNPLNPLYSNQPSGGAAGGGTSYSASLPDQEMQALRATPEHQFLFGHMPGNMDETSYAQQNANEATAAFGAEGAHETDAIRAGMASGQYGTTSRYLAATPEADTNSHFQQNLAKMAQTVAAMT